MGSRAVTKAECDNCQRYLVEKIDSLRREVKLLLGTTTITIILSVIQLIIAR